MECDSNDRAKNPILHQKILVKTRPDTKGSSRSVIGEPLWNQATVCYLTKGKKGTFYIRKGNFNEWILANGDGKEKMSQCHEIDRRLEPEKCSGHITRVSFDRHSISWA